MLIDQFKEVPNRVIVYLIQFFKALIKIKLKMKKLANSQIISY